MLAYKYEDTKYNYLHAETLEISTGHCINDLHPQNTQKQI